MANENSMTHDDLVERAKRWLKNSCGCSVTLTEMVAYTPSGEIPDAIGWVGGKSILVECKASRSDFLKDRKKPFRNPDFQKAIPGMGAWRIYLTPPGIIKPTDKIDLWSVYEISQTRVTHKHGPKYSNMVTPPFSPCLRSENALLISALRRHHETRSNN